MPRCSNSWLRLFPFLAECQEKCRCGPTLILQLTHTQHGLLPTWPLWFEWKTSGSLACGCGSWLPLVGPSQWEETPGSGQGLYLQNTQKDWSKIKAVLQLEGWIFLGSHWKDLSYSSLSTLWLIPKGPIQRVGIWVSFLKAQFSALTSQNSSSNFSKQMIMNLVCFLEQKVTVGTFLDEWFPNFSINGTSSSLLPTLSPNMYNIKSSCPRWGDRQSGYRTVKVLDLLCSEVPLQNSGVLMNKV